MASLLEVDQLKIDARKDDGSLTPIVKGVSFNVERGEVVALIGESGSGKTTIALSALGYTKPGLEFTSGEVRLHGQDVISMPSEEKRLMRFQSCPHHRGAGDGVSRSAWPVEPGRGKPESNRTLSGIGTS